MAFVVTGDTFFPCTKSLKCASMEPPTKFEVSMHEAEYSGLRLKRNEWPPFYMTQTFHIVSSPVFHRRTEGAPATKTLAWLASVGCVVPGS